MKPFLHVLRSLSLRAFVFVGALGLQACHDGFLDLDSGGSSGGNRFPPPMQLGGLAPSNGSEMLDASFAAEGVFESSAFVGRLPVRVVVDRMSRPLLVGFNPFPSGLLVLRLTEAGTSDPTFGAGGALLLTNDATVTDEPFRAPACLIDAFDRILLFSTRLVFGNPGRALVVRLEPDGALDLSFGDQGRVVLEPTAGAIETSAVSLALDPSGRILACANESGPGGRRMLVARFDESGVLDGDFGAGGIASGPQDEESVGVSVLADPAGGVVIAGSLPTGPARVALWRFDAAGSLDPGFGSGGLVTRSDPHVGLDVAAVDAVTDAFGRIYVLGNRSHDLPEIDDWPTQVVDFKTIAPPVFDAIVWRFLPDGALDSGFADAGARILAFNSGPYVDVGNGLFGGDHFDAAAGLFLDEAGRIVLAGWSEQAFWDTTIGWAAFVAATCPFLIRLTPNGTLDTDFRGIGHAQMGWDLVTEPGPATTPEAQGHLTAIARDAQGRWLLAGSTLGGSTQRVWRIVP